MTFGELIAETNRKLREVQADPRYWNEDDVKESLNEGYVEISDAVEWNEKYQIIEILKSQSYYDARTVLRSGYLVLGPAYNMTTSRWLIPVTPRDLEFGDLRWEEREAEPEYLMVRGLWWFSFWPVKQIAEGKVKQYYHALPTPLEDEEDEPGFHSSLHYGLVEYALFDLFSSDGETDLAWQHWKEYLTYESALHLMKQGRASAPLQRGMGRSENGS